MSLRAHPQSLNSNAGRTMRLTTRCLGHDRTGDRADELRRTSAPYGSARRPGISRIVLPGAYVGVGLDLAKPVFQAYRIESETAEMRNVPIKRAKLIEHFAIDCAVTAASDHNTVAVQYAATAKRSTRCSGNWTEPSARTTTTANCRRGQQLGPLQDRPVVDQGPVGYP